MLKPLGLQHQFLARRPLGQTQSLEAVPPLGTSMTAIAQTFPVLQLSLEQSARSSQTEMFADGFASFPSAAFQSDVGSPSSSERSLPDQPSASSPPTPASILQSPTVESTAAKENAFPDHLSLLARKPLSAPEPLGSLLPLEQSSEQPSGSIDTQQEPSPDRLQASFSDSMPSAMEPSIIEVPVANDTPMIQPSVELESVSSSIAANPTNTTTDPSDPPAHSITPLAVPEVAQATPLHRQPNVPSSQALQPITEASATSIADGLSASDHSSKSDRLSERVSEIASPPIQLVSEQPVDTVQLYALAETLEADTAEAEMLDADTAIYTPASTAIESPLQSEEESIANPLIVEPLIVEPSIAMQRSGDVPSIASIPSIVEVNTVPLVVSNTQHIENAEDVAVEHASETAQSETAQPETTESESTTPIDPITIAATDGTSTTLPQTGQTIIPPTDTDRRAVDTLQRQSAIEPSVDLVQPLTVVPTQDDRSDVAALSIGGTDNPTLDAPPARSTLPQTESTLLETRQPSTEPLVQAAPDRKTSETAWVESMASETESTAQVDPTAIAGIQRVENTEEPAAAKVAQTTEPASTELESTESEPTTQVDPDTIAATDETSTTLLQTGQTIIPPTDTDHRAVDTLQRQSAIEPSVKLVQPLTVMPTQDDRSDVAALSIGGADNPTLGASPVRSALPQTESTPLETRQPSIEPLAQAAPDRKTSAPASVASMESLLVEPIADVSTVSPMAVDGLNDPSTPFGDCPIDRPTEGTIQTAAVPDQVSSSVEPLNPVVEIFLQERDGVGMVQLTTESLISESSSEQASAPQGDGFPSLLNTPIATPLVSPKNLVTPSLPSVKLLVESPIDGSLVSESPIVPSAEKPIHSLESTTIARKPIVSSESTAPTVQAPASAPPDSWSSLDALLNQRASDQPDARSWQDVVADLNNAPQTPGVQRLDSKDVGTASVIASTPSESIALFHTDASAQGQTNRVDDEKLDQLALAVYGRLRIQLESDRERHGCFTSGHQLWLGTVIPAVNFTSEETKSTQKNQQKLEANDRLSPLDAKLERLTGEVYYLLRSQIEIAQERCALRNSYHY